MPSQLGRNLESVLKNIQLNDILPPEENVPVDPSQFYSSFGYLQHPYTRKPVKLLAPYQYEIWQSLLKHRCVLVVKSHKIGISTSSLMTDFQLAILPSKYPISCCGFDQLVIAETKDLAKEHLRNLRKMIIRSKKYSAYLMDRLTEIDEGNSRSLMRDEQTKTSVIYVRNPEDETRPSRIIALGADNPGAIESWPNIKHVQISDITATIGDHTESLNVAMTRLANTNGSIIIGTIPCPPQGPIYDMWLKYRAKTEIKEGDFKVFDIPVDQGVNAGVVLQSFVDAEKERDPVNFDRNYMAKFSALFGNVFSSDVIERAIELGKKYDPDRILTSAKKSQGIDEGFGSSNFGIVVVQRIDEILQVIMADEHVRPDIDQEIYDAAARIQTWKIASTQCDAAQPAYITALKRKIGENPHYEQLPKESHRWMKVRPIQFGTTHKAMLGNAVILMEKGKVAIHPKFDKLLTALRTAIAQDYSLDKDQTVNHNLLDAFRLALEPYSIRGKN